MPVLKRFLPNVKFGKGKECRESEPFVQPNLKRSNAKVFKKRNGSRDSIPGVEFLHDEIRTAQNTAKTVNPVPTLSKESGRRYSFEPGASVENFEAELEIHSKRLQKKPKKQHTQDSLDGTTLKPNFGLKVNNTNLSSFGPKAASTLDLPIRVNQEAKIESNQPACGRYGLAPHPDNVKQRIVKGGCWESVPTPSLNTAKWTQTCKEPSSKDSDPFEEAKQASERWNRPASFEEGPSSMKARKISIYSNRRHSADSAGGAPLNADVGDGSDKLSGGGEAEPNDRALQSSPADSAVSFDIAHVVQCSHCTEQVAGKGGKGKEKQRLDREEVVQRTMPGSFPDLDQMDNVQVHRQSSSTAQMPAYQFSSGKVLSKVPGILRSASRESLNAQLKTMQDLDRERRGREKAEALEAELKRQQEEADRLVAEEADRLAAEEAARLAEEEEVRQKLRECVACADSKDPFDFPARPPTNECEHDVHTCSECLQSWMASEFETKGCDDIKCPECPKTLQYNDVQSAASIQTFEAYDKLATRNALGALDEFAWCLGPNCGSGQLNIGNNDFMHCVNCGYKQCLKHKVAWHKGETCKQYEYRTSGQKARDDERATEKMIDTVSKMCPGKGCGWRIQKTDGCDHMTCKRCKHQFCWQCMAAQSEIKRVGNTAHQKSCKFHSTNLDIAYPFNAH